MISSHGQHKKSQKNLKANGNSVVSAFQKVQFLDVFRII